MRCDKCGFETPNNSNFCCHCGAKIEFLDDFLGEELKEEKIKEEPKEEFDPYQGIDMSKASIFWYFLGLLSPIIGIILFFIYIYQKPDLALKARRGAIHGFIFNCILMFIAYMYVIFRGGV